MTVAELKAIIAQLPDDAPVYTRTGHDLYCAPADIVWVTDHPAPDSFDAEWRTTYDGPIAAVIIN